MRRAVGAQRVSGLRARLGQREQEVLRGDVLVLEAGQLAFRGAQDGQQLAGSGRLVLGAGAHGRQGVEGGVDVGAHVLGPGLDPAQHGRDDRFRLVEEHGEEVLRQDFGVTAARRQPDGDVEGLSGLLGEALSSHLSSRTSQDLSVID
jgi:hypothetical protein